MHVYATQQVPERKREKLRIESLEEFNLRYESRFRAIADSMTTKNAICSNELLFGLNTEAIRRLKDALSWVFSSVQIVLYLRRQDLLETSAYLQAYKGGYDHLRAFDTVLKRRRPGHLAVIERWSEIFGCKDVKIFLYDDVMREEKDIIGHFMRALGVRELSRFLQVAPRNASWGLYQAYASRVIRQSCKSEPFQHIKDFVETIEPGPRYPVQRAEAVAFYRSFAGENEAIRMRYFPDKAFLFEQDFSMYPETFDMEAAKSTYSPSELLEQYNKSRQRRQPGVAALARSIPLRARKLWQRGPWRKGPAVGK